MMVTNLLTLIHEEGVHAGIHPEGAEERLKRDERVAHAVISSLKEKAIKQLVICRRKL